MLHLFLFVLKILFYLILILLGIILAAVLLVLFVPIRYGLEGSYLEKIEGKADFSWLLHILSVRVIYDEEISLTVRLFGFRIMKPKKMNEEILEAEDILVQTMEIKEPEAVREIRKTKNEIKSIPSELRINEKQEFKKQKNEKKPWFFFIYERLKKFVLTLLKKLKFFFHQIYDTLKSIKEKKDKIFAWFSNKENQKTIRLLVKQGKKLIKHILPVKGKGNITFGFEDPYLTGQVLMYVSVIYPLCHKQINLYPDFEQSLFKAEGSFYGRIRVGTLLFICLRMLMDKNFRKLLRKWLR